MRKLVKLLMLSVILIVSVITSYNININKKTTIFINNIEALAAGEYGKEEGDCMFSGDIECRGEKSRYSNLSR